MPAECTRRSILPSFSWAARTASTQPRSVPRSACTGNVPGGDNCVRCCAETRMPWCNSSWATLVLLLGMMVMTSVMARAGIFNWISWLALRRAHGPRALLAILVLVAGALSALLVNDTVCLMCTPLVVALIEAAALPPLPYLLGLAFASNAGSVATLTGNPQKMLIGALCGIF